MHHKSQFLINGPTTPTWLSMCSIKHHLIESYALLKSTVNNVPGLFLFFSHITASFVVSMPSVMYLSSINHVWVSLITSPITGFNLLVLDTIFYQQLTTLIGLYSSIDLGFWDFGTKNTHVMLMEGGKLTRGKEIFDKICHVFTYYILQFLYKIDVEAIIPRALLWSLLQTACLITSLVGIDSKAKIVELENCLLTQHWEALFQEGLLISNCLERTLRSIFLSHQSHAVLHLQSWCL